MKRDNNGLELSLAYSLRKEKKNEGQKKKECGEAEVMHKMADVSRADLSIADLALLEDRKGCEQTVILR